MHTTSMNNGITYRLEKKKKIKRIGPLAITQDLSMLRESREPNNLFKKGNKVVFIK